jgi:uncharacterized metal-binding protein YceD (DUF177 family)
VTPEFSRTLRADAIGAAPRAMEIAADPAERAALAKRFGLLALDALEADVSLVRAQEDIVASGRVAAALAQPCVVTGAPVAATIDEPFTIRFRPPPSSAADEEVELGEDELDVMFVEGAEIDVGEAVAQTLALALPDYPRSPEAETRLREAGVQDEGAAGPFSALAGLRDKLK